jgi:hypothetical protein
MPAIEVGRIADDVRAAPNTFSILVKKSVRPLLMFAAISWGTCYAYVSSTIHFGWLGTLLALGQIV